MQKQDTIQIVVCGGGNGAHTTTGYVGSKPQFHVCVFTRKPKEWKPEIKVTTKGSAWESKGDFVGKVFKASSDPKDFPKGTKLWICCGPNNIHEQLLKQIAPYVEKNSYVGTIFSQGGFDWKANYIFGDRIKKDNITVFGLFTIPWICKIINYGESTRIIGPKESLSIAVQSKDQNIIAGVKTILEKMYDIPIKVLPNFLTLTLCPSNQIIHPGRIYGVFKDWDGKTPFKPEKIPLFYEDMDDFSAQMLENLDNEIQAIKKAIVTKYPQVDLSGVKPMKDRIKDTYGDQVKDNTNMKTTFATNLGYRTVKIPVKEVPGGVIPNVDGRIFWEDVPFGLCILHDLGELVSVKTPWVDKMIEWHQKFMNKVYIINGKLNEKTITETGAPSRYGFKTIEDILILNCYDIKKK